MNKIYSVYVMTNKPRGTLYIGVTNDIERRVFEHKYEASGFVKKYKLDKLVYVEYFDDIETAIRYEKCIKRYVRKWKIELIEKQNPYWQDLGNMILGQIPPTCHHQR